MSPDAPHINRSWQPARQPSQPPSSETGASQTAAHCCWQPPLGVALPPNPLRLGEELEKLHAPSPGMQLVDVPWVVEHGRPLPDWLTEMR